MALERDAGYADFGIGVSLIVNFRKVATMQEYDLYINAKKPAIGLYVRKGANLPDLADKTDWVFGGTAAQDLLPSSVVEGIAADGHAFRNMG